MAGTVRGAGRSGESAGAVARSVPGRGGGTGPRVAGPVRPVGDRVAVRPAGRPFGPPAGAPPLRRDAVRPGARPLPAAGRRVPVRAGRPAAVAAGGGRLRLTRRGWVVLVALAVSAAALVLLALSALVGGGGELELAGGSSVVVRAGDTVWSIAATVAGPGEDVRAVVDAIEQLNDLEGSVVVPGQVLEVP